ncbi:MAG: hypothetical protein M3680_29605 [Myxococcota bacterium]|nr:hypothetical protein [Myxococcota bacterium]
MVRWWIVLLLTVASATAMAQPAVTARAQQVASGTERRVGQLVGETQRLRLQYEGELRAIDRLKQQRKSWRQERELKERLSNANETATALARVTRELAGAQGQLTGARRSLIAAIDGELAAGAVGPRAQQLARLKAQLVPPTRRPVHRIKIPNLELDPGADPEDLDLQAAELRALEAELQHQISGLEKQSKNLERVAELRKSHDRASVLDRRDDGQPSRNPQQASGGREALDGAASPEDADTTGGTGGPPDQTPSFEAEATVVLADVVDPTTIDTLTRAHRSGDPAQRAKAAARTRDAVKAKLDLLRLKRAQIEQRAKQLRK